MKKTYLSLLLPAVLLSLGACSDDDPKGPVGPDGEEITSVAGAFVVCNGQMTNGIAGSITNLDVATGKSTLGAFAAANGRTLGVSANDALVYGDKLYIVSTDENMIEVVNRNTMKSLASISTVTLMGDDKGDKPRYLACANGCVYVSTYSGYVGEIEVNNFSLRRTFKVGSYPEGMLAVDSKVLYVANSDYGQGVNPSISRIDLTSGEVKDLKFEGLRNPRWMYYVAGKVFVLDGGNYDASWNQENTNLYQIDGEKLVKVADATMAAADNSRIYVCNAPYHTPVLTPTYGVYDVTSGKYTAMNEISVDSPAFIGINILSGNIFVGSYNIDPETHYALFTQNGYVREFTPAGQKVRDFECGVGPVSIIFNYGH